MSSGASQSVNMHDAKTHLSRLIDRVEHGEEIVISRAGTPVAKIVPLHRTFHRTGRGSLRGQVTISEDWDSADVNEAIADDFGMPR
jgi:prevent-host-death family protein